MIGEYLHIEVAMPSSTKKPYNIYLICDDLTQFDQKFLNDLSLSNCNVIPVSPNDAPSSIKKNRALKAVISVPEISTGCGFRFLSSLRKILGNNVPMMVFAPVEI